MRLNKNLGVAVVIAIVFCSCAPSRFVQPLEDGEQAVSFNLGGPMINLFGAKLPVPLSAVTYAKGFKNELNLFGSLHTTSLPFGVLQTEIGIVKGITAPDSLLRYKPGLTVSHTVNLAYDIWDNNFRFWPQVDLNSYWKYTVKNDNIIYLGVGNWFELAARRAHEEVQPTRWIFNPHIGHTFRGEKGDFNIEFKALAPNHSNEEVVIDYVKPFGSNGAMGLYVSYVRRF